MTGIRKSAVFASACALAGLLAAACGSSGNTASGNSGNSGTTGTVVIGASDSLTGPLGPLGVPEEAGQKQAVADINTAGGLTVGGKKDHVKLVVLDNRSNPTTASQQTKDLVLKHGAVGLLGGCTPPITVPEGLVAEQLRVPMITSCTPVDAFANGNKSGWHYAFDLFFKEQDQAKAAVAAVNIPASNKKVVIFTDTEPDGVTERPLYKAAAIAAGDTVVGTYSFPVGSANFTSFINEAKANGAQLVIGQMTPPTGVALWKQMKSLGFHPVAAFDAKAADSGAWVKALGSLSNGSLLETFWSAAEHNILTKHLQATLGKQFDFSDFNASLLGYTPAYVLMHAMEQAGTTSASTVVSTLEKVTMKTPLGTIHFSKQDTAVTPYFVSQWQGSKVVQIYPQVSGSQMVAPNPGLQ